MLIYTLHSISIQLSSGAAEPRGPGGQLTPTFSGAGPHMALDPHFFVVFTCALSVAIHSLIHSFSYCCSTHHR